MIPSPSLKSNLYFKKILKFCSLNIRSLTEVQKKLDSFDNLEIELKDEILNYFLKINVVLEDEKYINYYLENLSSSKGYTFNQLYLKLGNKVQNKQLLKLILSQFLKKTEDLQIERFIERNFRKLSRLEPGRKRLSYLVQKGFKVEIISKYLIKYNL